MKRIHVVSKTRFTIFVMIVMLLITGLTMSLLGQTTASAASASRIRTYDVVTVQSGDTLWSIAERHTESGQDVRKMIYTIKALNDLDSTGEIAAGQELMIPAA